MFMHSITHAARAGVSRAMNTRNNTSNFTCPADFHALDSLSCRYGLWDRDIPCASYNVQCRIDYLTVMDLYCALYLPYRWKSPTPSAHSRESGCCECCVLASKCRPHFRVVRNLWIYSSVYTANPCHVTEAKRKLRLQHTLKWLVV